ncbi:class C beta-lactamase-related serine hydrolase, partial [bacterium]|nr:class C beta-lactamase-related serine hydrolase [bacterium]
QSPFIHSVHIYRHDPETRVLSPILSKSYEGPDRVGTRDQDPSTFSRYVWKSAEDLGADKPHRLQSVSKSIASLVVGLAIQHAKRDFDIVNAPLVTILGPEALEEVPEGPKRDQVRENMATITLKDVLTMAIGLKWNLNYDAVMESPLPLWAQALACEPEAARSGKFSYCDGATNILGKVVLTLTGKPFHEFAREALFDPLGITHYEQKTRDSGPEGKTAIVSGAFSMAPNDLAKIGQLVLQDGKWGTGDSTALDLSDWISLSIRPHIDFNTPGAFFGAKKPPYSGYGFQWWHYAHPTLKPDGKPLQVTIATGIGGQKLFIVKELNLLIITHGGFYRVEGTPEYSAMYGQLHRIFETVIPKGV